jgi:hypothetical protein
LHEAVGAEAAPDGGRARQCASTSRRAAVAALRERAAGLLVAGDDAGADVMTKALREFAKLPVPVDVEVVDLHAERAKRGGAD